MVTEAVEMFVRMENWDGLAVVFTQLPSSMCAQVHDYYSQQCAFTVVCKMRRCAWVSIALQRTGSGESYVNTCNWNNSADTYPFFWRHASLVVGLKILLTIDENDVELWCCQRFASRSLWSSLYGRLDFPMPPHVYTLCLIAGEIFAHPGMPLQLRCTRVLSAALF